jgi:type II secretory pathway pseudopilin PulG
MRQRGYTYLGLLLLLVLVGTVMAAAGVSWRTAVQREREAELLFVGHQIVDAITVFYERTPAGQRPRFPVKLEELLEDSRWPTVTRHLRRLYVDPMTGRPEWGLVRSPEGGIKGIYSLSPEAPIKHANFEARDAEFESASSYADWRFVYVAPGTTGN